MKLNLVRLHIFDHREQGVELPDIADQRDEQRRQPDAERPQDDHRARADLVGEDARRPGNQGADEQHGRVGAQELSAGPAELPGHRRQHVAKGDQRHHRGGEGLAEQDNGRDLDLAWREVRTRA